MAQLEPAEDVDSEDIYEDLAGNDLGERITQLEDQNEQLRDHVKHLNDDVEKLCNELTRMKQIEINLKNNISILFNTAKLEIERKNRTISELRQQLDNMTFRRRNGGTRPYQQPQEEPVMHAGSANIHNLPSTSSDTKQNLLPRVNDKQPCSVTNNEKNTQNSNLVQRQLLGMEKCLKSSGNSNSTVNENCIQQSTKQVTGLNIEYNGNSHTVNSKDIKIEQKKGQDYNLSSIKHEKCRSEKNKSHDYNLSSVKNEKSRSEQNKSHDYNLSSVKNEKSRSEQHQSYDYNLSSIKSEKNRSPYPRQFNHNNYVKEEKSSMLLENFETQWNHNSNGSRSPLFNDCWQTLNSNEGLTKDKRKRSRSRSPSRNYRMRRSRSPSGSYERYFSSNRPYRNHSRADGRHDKRDEDASSNHSGFDRHKSKEYTRHTPSHDSRKVVEFNQDKSIKYDARAERNDKVERHFSGLSNYKSQNDSIHKTKELNENKNVRTNANIDQNDLRHRITSISNCNESQVKNNYRVVDNVSDLHKRYINMSKLQNNMQITFCNKRPLQVDQIQSNTPRNITLHVDNSSKREIKVDNEKLNVKIKEPFNKVCGKKETDKYSLTSGDNKLKLQRTDKRNTEDLKTKSFEELFDHCLRGKKPRTGQKLDENKEFGKNSMDKVKNATDKLNQKEKKIRVPHKREIEDRAKLPRKELKDMIAKHTSIKNSGTPKCDVIVESKSYENETLKQNSTKRSDVKQFTTTSTSVVPQPDTSQLKEQEVIDVQNGHLSVSNNWNQDVESLFIYTS